MFNFGYLTIIISYRILVLIPADSSAGPKFKSFWVCPDCLLLSAIHTLVTVRYVKKEVFFMMFLVKLTHGCTCGRDNIVDKEEQCILWSKVNSFADEEIKLTNC